MVIIVTGEVWNDERNKVETIERIFHSEASALLWMQRQYRNSQWAQFEYAEYQIKNRAKTKVYPERKKA